MWSRRVLQQSDSTCFGNCLTNLLTENKIERFDVMAICKMKWKIILLWTIREKSWQIFMNEKDVPVRYEFYLHQYMKNEQRFRNCLKLSSKFIFGISLLDSALQTRRRWTVLSTRHSGHLRDLSHAQLSRFGRQNECISACRVDHSTEWDPTWRHYRTWGIWRCPNDYTWRLQRVPWFRRSSWSA